MGKVIGIASDLHLEFGHTFNIPDDIDVLVLAGDVCTGKTRHLFEELIDRAPSPIEKIYYVPGNHDYWFSSIEDTHSWLWDLSSLFPRFVPFITGGKPHDFLTKDICVMGSTLWYPDTPDCWFMQNSMNDFTYIEGFTPAIAIEENRRAHDYFEKAPKDTKLIWITHHLPSYQSCDPKYKGSRLNCYYVDPSMEKLIERLQPSIYIHGHSHEAVQYKIRNTLVMSNPRGYPGETNNWKIERIIIV